MLKSNTGSMLRKRKLLKPNLNRSCYPYITDIRLSMHKGNSHADSHISADSHEFSFCTHLCLRQLKWTWYKFGHDKMDKFAKYSLDFVYEHKLFVYCWIKPIFAGAQPEIFQGRGGLPGLGHFYKHFVKNSRKKGPARKNLRVFSPRYP